MAILIGIGERLWLSALKFPDSGLDISHKMILEKDLGPADLAEQIILD